jgi:hypothetical protein
MLEFERKVMITGAEQRQKKDGTSYILIHVMGDNGVTLSCMYKGDANKVMGLEKMSDYSVKFSISVGQYTQFNVVDINKVVK